MSVKANLKAWRAFCTLMASTKEPVTTLELSAAEIEVAEQRSAAKIAKAEAKRERRRQRNLREEAGE